jgi:hypothetical protein
MVLAIGAATTFLGRPSDSKFSRETFDNLTGLLDPDTARAILESRLGPPAWEKESDDSELDDHYETFRSKAQCASKVVYVEHRATNICLWKGVFREDWRTTHHMELMVAFDSTGRLTGWSAANWYDPPGLLEKMEDWLKSRLLRSGRPVLLCEIALMPTDSRERAVIHEDRLQLTR